MMWILMAFKAIGEIFMQRRIVGLTMARLTLANYLVFPGMAIDALKF